jgi:hypothetical protein
MTMPRPESGDVPHAIGTPRSGPPSPARRPLPPPADGDDGHSPADDEPFIQLGDGDDWPASFDSARLGMH